MNVSQVRQEVIWSNWSTTDTAHIECISGKTDIAQVPQHSWVQMGGRRRKGTHCKGTQSMWTVLGT